jgi:MFS family permease
MSTISAAGPLAPLVRQAKRAERMLLPAAFITNAGNSFQLTASAVLVFRAEQTTLSVGWLFIAVSVPQVLLSVFFGRLADRVDRRTLCIIADLASAATALALPVWLWIGGAANLGSYLANFLLACISACFMPSSNALIKERISDSRIGKFNANFEIATQTGILVFAALAGFFVQWFGAIPLFLANSATFVASALLSVALGRRVFKPDAEPAPASADPAAPPGLDPPVLPSTPAAPVRAGAPLVRLGMLYAVGSVVIAVINTLLTVAVLSEFKLGPGYIGVIDALATTGVIAGAAGYKRLSRLLPGKRIALLGFLGCAVCTAIEPLSPIALMIAILVSGFFFSSGRVAARTLLMSATPEARAGRVFGTTNAYGLAFGVAGALVLSVVADHGGIPAAFWGLAAVIGIGTIVASALLAGYRPDAPPAAPLDLPVPAHSGEAQ